MNRKFNNQGFTLLEVIIVIVVLGILSTVIYPSFSNIISSSQERVCIANCLQLERTFSGYLALKNGDDNELWFYQFVQEYDLEDYIEELCCPTGGNIYYSNGQIRCSFHKNMDDTNDDDDEDEDDDGSVPFI